MVSILLIFGLLWANFVHCSQETWPKNSQVCDTHYKQDKDRLECRKSLAGGLECSNREACTNIRCKDSAVARRAGMTCSHSPFYNGGYPLSEIRWDEENEVYICQQGGGGSNASNYDYCFSWVTIEDSADEYEFGRCNCTEERLHAPTGRFYCYKWHCKQRETKKCAADEHSIPSDYPTKCCYSCRDSNDNNHLASECYENSATGRRCWYTPHSEYEFSDATCLKVDETAGFCAFWTQEEYDEHDIAFREYEKYTCKATDGFLCSRWDGDIDSEEEFEFSECECKVTSSNGKYCDRWECFEKGQDYFFPNLLWSILSIILGTFGGVGLVFLFYCFCDGEAMWYWVGGVVGFLNMCGFLILCVWLGGLGVFAIHWAVTGGFLISGIFCLYVVSSRSYFKRKAFGI
ncbi:hypothetical protein AAMO2058_001005300 [Amorphochlora amoebiformis]